MGEHPCRSEILIKLQSNFIEITLRNGCSAVNLLHIFRTPYTKNTSGWLLLSVDYYYSLHKKLLHLRKMNTFGENSHTEILLQL